jgi:AraC-like DNA-binding protein
MSRAIALNKETTVLGPRTRRWRVEVKVCAELAAHHMARLGIETAVYPYCIVRLQPKGSFFLATLEGEGRVRLEGRWQRVTAGSLCMAPPRVLNALYAPAGKPWVFAWVLDDEPSWVKPLVGAASPLRVLQGAAQLGHVITGFRREWEGERDPAQVHHWISLVHGLALRSARPWQTGSRLGKLWDAVAQELVTDWKLTSLAARGHVSAEHLRRLCLRDLGRTPMEHVGYMRIQRAQKLLETTDLKMEALAAEVGYHSGDVFTRAFARYVGMTPSEYRAGLMRKS